MKGGWNMNELVLNDLWKICGWPVDDYTYNMLMICGQHLDDMWITAGQHFDYIRMTCRWLVDVLWKKFVLHGDPKTFDKVSDGHNIKSHYKCYIQNGIKHTERKEREKSVNISFCLQHQGQAMHSTHIKREREKKC